MSIPLANPVGLPGPDVLHALGAVNLDARQDGIVTMHRVNSELNHSFQFLKNDGVRNFGQAQQVRNVTVSEFAKQVLLQQALLNVIRINAQSDAPTGQFLLKAMQCPAGMGWLQAARTIMATNFTLGIHANVRQGKIDMAFTPILIRRMVLRR